MIYWFETKTRRLEIFASLFFKSKQEYLSNQEYYRA